MSERDEPGTVLELRLSEPQAVAWLEDSRSEPDEAPDDDGPAAA